MLSIWIGRAGAGKSRRVLETMARQRSQRPQVLLVPEHISHEAEVDLCRALGPTASRDAEVLSFQSLGSRVLARTGGLAEFTLDGGGKLLTMRLALQELHSRLKVFGRPSQRAAFLRQLTDLTEEFYAYEITPQALWQQVEDMEGAMGDKLRDLALLYAAYDGKLHAEGVDARSRIQKLRDRLAESDYLRGKDVYLDGFSYLNKLEESVLEQVMRQAESVTVTLLGDRAEGTLFQNALRQRQRLERMARQLGTECEIVWLTGSGKGPLAHLEKHLLGEGALLRRLIESGAEANLIFYGPSGTGKTTIANIIARRTKKTLYHLNATTASLQDVKAIIGDVDTMMAPNGVLLYLDEIQYFNKKQQQSLLEFMENGKITLIASTTENPFFYVYNALLSRSTVFEFKALTPEETVPAVERALALQQQRSSLPLSWEEEVPRLIAAGCGGDVRKAVNAVELLYQSAKPRDGGLLLTTEDAQVLAQRSAMRYDREGDQHYDLLSALQKSIRGSDPDAAVYYLGRLLAAGDLLSPCRRLLVIAAEDVGLAYPQAIVVTKACVDAALQLGLPEGRLPLAEAAVLLATAPKSNSAHNAIIAAMQDIDHGKVGPVPRHLQNVHADSAGTGKVPTYKYPHVYPNHYVKQQYLPDLVKDAVYYEYGPNKTEQAAKRYWDEIKGDSASR